MKKNNLEVERIKAAIMSVAEERLEFTADEVRARLGFVPSNPNYWGIAFSALKDRKIRVVGGGSSKTYSRNSGHLYRWKLLGSPGVKPLVGWF